MPFARQTNPRSMNPEIAKQEREWERNAKLRPGNRNDYYSKQTSPMANPVVQEYKAF